MLYKITAGIMLVFWVVTIPAYAQVVDSTDIDNQTQVLFLPALGSTPETGFMFGGVVMPQFKIGQSEEETRTSSVLFSGIYTTKNQVLVGLLADLIFPNEEWIAFGTYGGNYIPDSYWGIGPLTRNNQEMEMLYTEFNIEQTVLHQVRPSIFLGPYVEWSKRYNISFKDSQGDMIPTPEIPGADGSEKVGVGFMARSDRRNSNITPTRNHLVEFSFLIHPGWLGSTDPYNLWLLDARKYIDLGGDENSILALQGLFRFTSGDPSFFDMSTIGGGQVNRGYFKGRYRDQNSLQVQAEWRKHLIGRFGFTMFAGSGEVWDRFEDLTIEKTKWSLGAGLRFNLNKKNPTNIRIDYGIGRNSSGFYIQFGEAF